MVTVEQFKKLSPRDSLWWVDKSGNATVMMSSLFGHGAPMELKCAAIENNGAKYFLTKEEAEEESERLRLMWRLQE